MTLSKQIYDLIRYSIDEGLPEEKVLPLIEQRIARYLADNKDYETSPAVLKAIEEEKERREIIGLADATSVRFCEQCGNPAEQMPFNVTLCEKHSNELAESMEAVNTSRDEFNHQG